MNDTLNINWSTLQGRVELHKIGSKLNITLPPSYAEQRKWAFDVVTQVKGSVSLGTIKLDSLSHELLGPTKSSRAQAVKVGSLPSYIPQLETKIEVSSVAINHFDLKDVKVLALFNLGFVFFDTKNRVIEDISSQYYPLLELNPNLNELLCSCERYTETSTFIADWFFERNYAHWLLDTIPRLLKREGKVVCHAPKNSWQKELLLIYGVDNKDIVPIEPNSCISFKRLLLDGKNSCPVPHPSYKCHSEALEFIRKPLRTVVKADSESKVALVVKRFDSRVIVNSDRLEEMLVQLGYIVQVIDCARVSVPTQIKCFAEAELIFGAHGAAMANTAFCKAGARVFEVFPPCYGNPAFWAVSNTVGASYIAVTAVEEVTDDSKHARYRDIKLTERCFTLLNELLTNN